MSEIYVHKDNPEWYAASVLTELEDEFIARIRADRDTVLYQVKMIPLNVSLSQADISRKRAELFDLYRDDFPSLSFREGFRHVMFPELIEDILDSYNDLSSNSKKNDFLEGLRLADFHTDENNYDALITVLLNQE